MPEWIYNFMISTWVFWKVAWERLVDSSHILTKFGGFYENFLVREAGGWWVIFRWSLGGFMKQFLREVFGWRVDFHEVQGVFCKIARSLVDDLYHSRVIWRLLFFWLMWTLSLAASATRFQSLKDCSSMFHAARMHSWQVQAIMCFIRDYQFYNKLYQLFG